MRPLVVPASSEPAGKQIDFVAKRLAEVVKPAAFKRAARRFNRVLRSASAIDTAQCFNLQGSQGNLGSEGRFCVNLGVWFPELSAVLRQLKRWQPTLAPDKLGPHHCHIYLRLDSVVPPAREDWWPAELVPGRDSWFHVGPGRDLRALADSLARVFETSVLPWFSERASLEAVALGLPPTTAEQRAIALGVLGKPTEAREVYASGKREQPDLEAWLAGLG